MYECRRLCGSRGFLSVIITDSESVVMDWIAGEMAAGKCSFVNIRHGEITAATEAAMNYIATDGKSIFENLAIAFERAIENGTLSQDPLDANYAGNFIYFGTFVQKWAGFRNIKTNVCVYDCVHTHPYLPPAI